MKLHMECNCGAEFTHTSPKLSMWLLDSFWSFLRDHDHCDDKAEPEPTK